MAAKIFFIEYFCLNFQGGFEVEDEEDESDDDDDDEDDEEEEDEFEDGEGMDFQPGRGDVSELLPWNTIWCLKFRSISNCMFFE